jgi:hypothetical protein
MIHPAAGPPGPLPSPRFSMYTASTMPIDKADLIRLLEAELDVIEGGGYGLPAGQPNAERPMFEHSLVCINHWFVPGHKPECHDDCVLLEAVPEQHRTAGLPCHHIPLNAAGDTVESLERTGDRERLEREVKQWLRGTIERLKQQARAPDAQEAKY